MIKGSKPSNELAEELLKTGFIVRPGFPGMEEYIRVSIGTKEQMQEFVKELAKAIA